MILKKKVFRKKSIRYHNIMKFPYEFLSFMQIYAIFYTVYLLLNHHMHWLRIKKQQFASRDEGFLKKK